ncbi:MAG: 50S ribosomal protein L2 [Candidatus Micrarchaeales archaeon]|nr:50S ribosomal protein L2 [Candidatus Micrarchaeales archaeon]
MGKRLKQQRRGKGSVAYRKAPGTFDISVGYTPKRDSQLVGEVVDIIHHTGHTAPLAEVKYEDFTTGYLLAPEGIKIGDRIHIGPTPHYTLGSVMKLGDIPEGIPIYNIESMPGDGGKMTRSAGSVAYVSAHIGNMTTIAMPSKKSITLSSECRAQLGVVAGGGMDEQPIVKAGKNHYIMHAINKMWPTYRGVKLNPVDHPFGGKQHHKGKSSMTSRNAPPGRKVGHIAARRVGRKKKG